MRDNRFNAEGYHDPTAYEALNNIEKEERLKKINNKIVFICSPFGGDIKGNTIRARRYGRFAVTERSVPIIPHLMYPQFLEEANSKERQLGIYMGLILLSKCHELWVFGDRISSGMGLEITQAKKLKIPIRYFSIQCEEKTGEK